MSKYQLNKAMRMVVFNLDPKPAERCKADRAAYATEFDLTDEERTALRDADIPKLYSMGVQPFILISFAVFLRDAPFNSLDDFLEFSKEFAASVAPYGYPDFS